MNLSLCLHTHTHIERERERIPDQLMEMLYLPAQAVTAVNYHAPKQGNTCRGWSEGLSRGGCLGDRYQPMPCSPEIASHGSIAPVSSSLVGDGATILLHRVFPVFFASCRELRHDRHERSFSDVFFSLALLYDECVVVHIFTPQWSIFSCSNKFLSEKVSK